MGLKIACWTGHSVSWRAAETKGNSEAVTRNIKGGLTDGVIEGNVLWCFKEDLMVLFYLLLLLDKVTECATSILEWGFS